MKNKPAAPKTGGYCGIPSNEVCGKYHDHAQKTPMAPIPQITGYMASRDGRIFSFSNWRGYGVREITQIPNGKGYLKVRISMGGRRRNLPVHRLIAATFLPINPGSDFEVCHNNGDRWDNRATNLRWGTRKDNADDRERHGRTSRGEKHSKRIREGLSRSTGEGA
jgi:hypothetical protein